MLTLYKYSSSLVKNFQREKQKLEKILYSKCIIEHIGSTAIPGTEGKGVIDIMLVFNNKRELNKAVKLLSKKSYYLSTNNIKDRIDRIFMSSAGTKESSLGDIHLHLTTINSDVYKDAVLFRDYLINHPEAKQEYVDLKYRILKAVGQNRVEYTKRKKQFIEKILKLAKKIG